VTISLFEPEDLESRLRRLGLTEVDEVRTHANRTVMLSLRRRVLRIHRGYAHAPDQVLVAIVRFLRRGARRDTRRAAEQEFLAFPVHRHVQPAPRRADGERPRPGDAALLERLRECHRQLNLRHFAGALGEIPIRLSGRMRRRLGELVADLETGRPVAIVLGRRHLRRDPWSEVEHTLLHEMVHQWQAEEGRTLDHGRDFRSKAREVGIVARAVRATWRTHT
jgi:hypothetical protein